MDDVLTRAEFLQCLLTEKHEPILAHDTALRARLEAVENLTLMQDGGIRGLHEQIADLHQQLATVTAVSQQYVDELAQMRKERDDFLDNLTRCKGNELAAELNEVKAQLAAMTQERDEAVNRSGHAGA